jgi:hypothetical protein
MMRHSLGKGLVGLFVTFLLILFVLPYVKRVFPQVSGFEDMTCQEGRKPCAEGYFCAQTTCVPILPKFDVNKVQPSSDY